MRDFQRPGRSTVYGTEFMLATPHPLATSAGIEMMHCGGNAIDAAIAAMAVLCVVDPAQVGLGGDCFALLCPGQGGAPIIALDGAGAAPSKSNRDWYLENGYASLPEFGVHSVTIPGLVHSLERLENDHGKLGLSRVLQPAIRLAESGHPVHERVAVDWAAMVDKLRKHSASSAIFLPNGKSPSPGQRFENHALARALRDIADRGSMCFYEGWIAEDLVQTLRDDGGLHTTEDFASYSSQYVTPVSSNYQGSSIYQCPPSGQGLTALALLNILDCLEESNGPLHAEHFHNLAEASKIAYALRDAHLGDPRFADISMSEFLAPELASGRAAMIESGRVLDVGGPSKNSDTVYVAAVDRDRNAISLIGSLFRDFGSGITGKNSGILLHNRGSSFNLLADHPNCIAPKKRPMHTIMPGLSTRGDRIEHVFGVVGGDFQPVGHAALLSAILKFGCSPQDAIDLPRAFAFNGTLTVETGVPVEIVRNLERRGHVVVRSLKPLGGAQMVSCNWANGVLSGASDSRLDGQAAGE